MLQELSDGELEVVTGAATIPVNVYITIVEYNYTYNIIYAPIYVLGTISHSSVANGNTYTLKSQS